MKKILVLITFMGSWLYCHSQSFVVGGEANKYYPVVFKDLDWNNHRAAKLEIGRSDTHISGSWTGSLIAGFSFHTSMWGNGASFANTKIMQSENGMSGASIPFIADYRDATGANGSKDFIIWLKGGNVSYFFNSSVTQTPRVYDGVQHALPFHEENGPSLTFITALSPKINSYGESLQGTVYTNGSGLNYMAGNLGLGTQQMDGYKLAVNGKVRAREIKVEVANWPDYVFDEDYELKSLGEIEQFIKVNKHLPEIPSARQIQKDGLELGEMNKLLLKKIEELTLLLIAQQKQVEELSGEVRLLKLKK